MKRLELNPKRMGEWIKAKAGIFWKILTRRFGLKLVSFLLAIILWNYVISSDTSMTRTKILNGVKGQVTGQTLLSAYGLALSTDPAELLEGFTVRMDVAQSQYSYVTADNVRVSLDLSGIRTTGTQDVPLTAITTYGHVVSITPEVVTMTFEALDSRSIPVNVEYTGDVREDYWYNVSRTNPTMITVSGASSVVRSITQARVYCDVTDQESGFTRAEQYVLLDSEGNEINQAMLTRSSSSVSVISEVLPTREIPIANAISNAVTGYPADGYEVTEVSIQPDVVTVAADGELLSNISELKIEPVSVDGASQTFTAKAKISLLSDFRYSSAEEVYVTVTIDDEDSGEWVTVSGIEIANLPENYSAEYSIEGLRAWVSGDPELVKACKRSGLILNCELEEPTEGVNVAMLSVDAERYENLTIVPENDTVEILLTNNAEGED